MRRFFVVFFFFSDKGESEKLEREIRQLSLFLCALLVGKSKRDASAVTLCLKRQNEKRGIWI